MSKKPPARKPEITTSALAVRETSGRGKSDNSIKSVAAATARPTGDASRGVRKVTPEEVARAIASCRKARHRAFVRTLWLTGARVSEALAIRPQDLDPQKNTIALPTLKRRKEAWRVVPVPAAFVAELLYVAATHGVHPEGQIFPFGRTWAWRFVSRALVKAGVESRRARPHALRHGHAVHALEGGMSLHLVSQNLGHANVATTGARYLVGTAADRRAAYDKINW